MLTVNLNNVAIVVISEGNNPRLLNPDFLERNEIVAKGWKVENVLVTPPFAQVSYANGLQIFVEEQKLQFICSQPDSFDWIAELPRIASKYLWVLPHVSYRAVGLNYTFIGEDIVGVDAENRLIKEMLKEGPWLRIGGGVTGTAIELRYHSSKPQMNIKIGVSEESKSDQQGKKPRELLFSVNFHQDFGTNQNEEKETFINSIKARHEEFLEFLKELPL